MIRIDAGVDDELDGFWGGTVGGQLQAELGQLPVTNLRTSLSLGGSVIKFTASKTG